MMYSVCSCRLLEGKDKVLLPAQFSTVSKDRERSELLSQGLNAHHYFRFYAECPPPIALICEVL